MLRWCVALILVLGSWMADAATAVVHSHYFVNRDGLRLHYLEAGSGPRTIVFIPGWLMPAAIFQAQLEGLGGEFRVLAFDPRSQGDSEVFNGPHDPERRMDDMEDFLRAAAVGDYVLAGWSLGVMESLDFIERKPQTGLRGLILIDNSIGAGRPPAVSSGGGASRRNSLNPKVREQYLREFSREIFASPPPREMADAVLQSALQMPPRAANQLLAQPYPRTYWRDIVFRQSEPVLYVIRPRFRDQGQELLAKKGEGARVEVFEKAGHALFVDEAARFNELAASFARKVFTSVPDAALSASSVHSHL